MTEAHVPPRACGNDRRSHERAQWVVDARGAKHSSWKPGGLAVHGLCRDCNHSTSSQADPAYKAFHTDVQNVLRPGARRFLIDRDELPVRVAPGLVARSVLAGMFAINRGLRDRAPRLAEGLRTNQHDLRLPADLQLRLALSLDSVTRVGGAVGYMRVDRFRTFHMPLAEVWFPPLVWCLRAPDGGDLSLGPAFSAAWCDVSDWIRFGPDLETDLRNVSGTLPMTHLPRFGAEGWVLLTGDGVMSALDGRFLR